MMPLVDTYDVYFCQNHRSVYLTNDTGVVSSFKMECECNLWPRNSNGLKFNLTNVTLDFVDIWFLEKSNSLRVKKAKQ